MQQDDRGRHQADAEPCRCGCGVVRPMAEMTSSDCDVVREAHDTAVASGASASHAWRAAVGAYLERHPDASVFTAERLVSALVRPADGGAWLGLSSAPMPMGDA